MPVLERVLDIDPTNTAARMTLLGEAIRKEDYKEVIRLCEAGIESNPDMLEFYFYLSIAYNQATAQMMHLPFARKDWKTSRKRVIKNSFLTFMPSWAISITQRK